MIGALMGVPGKLKTLIDRLTSARATKLDNLDATMSSRAAASTALSTATWTSTRAGYLDNLNSAGALASIKSLQTAFWTGTIPNVGGTSEDGRYLNLTISAVTIAKSLVILQGYVYDPSGNIIGNSATARLTSTTNLRISVPFAGASTIYVRYYVVEFY